MDPVHVTIVTHTTIPPPSDGVTLVDSVFIRVDGRPIVFIARPWRTQWYNRKVDGRYYVDVIVTRESSQGFDLDRIALRMDAIGDTGTYPFDAAYAQPPKDGSDVLYPERSACYERQSDSPLTEVYSTTATPPEGAVHVERIDVERKIIYGTFTFVGHDDRSGDTIQIDSGAFRLSLLE